MAITVVQTATASALSFSFASNVTAGNTVIVCVSSEGGATGSISGITIGGQPDHFAEVSAAHEHVSNYVDVFIWADFNATGGSSSVTVSGSQLNVDGTGGGLVAYEVSGLASVDRTHAGTGSGTSWSSGATTTTAADEFWVGVANAYNGISAASSPWGGGHSFQYACSQYQVVSSTGAATYASTCTASEWAAAVATLSGPLPTPPSVRNFTQAAVVRAGRW